MIHLENPINVISGGYFTGDKSWNRSYSMLENCYKLYYMTHGNLWIKDDIATYKLKKGEMYIINGHKLRSYGTNSETFQTYWFHFIPQNSKLHFSMNEINTVTQLSEKAKSHILELDIFYPNFNTALFNKEDLLHNLKFQYTVYTAIIDTLKKEDINKLSLNFNFHRLKPAIKYIDVNFTQPICLEHLAKLCCLSSSHFHKTFVENVHETPQTYILKKRMTLALSLLNTSGNVKEIAYQLGYCDESHFSRAFKKFYGFTPGYYKRCSTTSML